MSNAKHTPGPWEAKAGATNRSALLTVYDSIGKGIAGIRTQNRPIEEADANAKLIAAAPDMLEALDRMMKAAIHCDPLFENRWEADSKFARAAIAKATSK